MSWWTYVVRTSGTESPKAMQDATKIDGPNFSKWKSGQVPRAETVARFARAYGRPVLEAFVAAGFLTEAEAKVRPSGSVDFTKLSNQELLDIVASRMSEGGEHGGDTAATNAARHGGLTAVPDAARDTGRLTERQRREAAERDPNVDPPGPEHGA